MCRTRSERRARKARRFRNLHPLENQRLCQPGGWLDQNWLAPTLCRWGISFIFGAVMAYCIVGAI